VDAKSLRDVLAALTEAGARRARFEGGQLVEVEFGGKALAPAAAVTTFTDPQTGEPVDLNEGASELADASVDAEIAARNFERGQKT